ncbi:hypothetical protein VTK73DRAFT_8179 [Phialemonium thermophilum]|uniref:Uncharacterized protein n=1 Tax=Phialemonium thermophilum TaxID=223376 RepID=A0ABR3XR44_9PEZI
MADDPAHHCIGVATANRAVRPYVTGPEPLTCGIPPVDGKGDSSSPGTIDAAGFLDEATDRRYVMYKADGNSARRGGSCGNNVAPRVATPLVLQEVNAQDRITAVGEPVPILEREDAEDGPLVETLSLVRVSGRYVLFYSRHCCDSAAYDVRYAVAHQVTRPYVRRTSPLLRTSNLGLTSPRGATGAEDGKWLVFHRTAPTGGACLERHLTSPAIRWLSPDTSRDSWTVVNKSIITRDIGTRC